MDKKLGKPSGCFIWVFTDGGMEIPNFKSSDDEIIAFAMVRTVTKAMKS
jgi:hypothetical protein